MKQYIFQCIVCRKKIKTSDIVLFHCGRLTQWISGIEGRKTFIEEKERKIFMREKTVRIKVRGYIEMSRENFDTIMEYKDPFMGIIESIKMGFANVDNLEFDINE